MLTIHYGLLGVYKIYKTRCLPIGPRVLLGQKCYLLDLPKSTNTGEGWNGKVKSMTQNHVKK